MNFEEWHEGWERKAWNTAIEEAAKVCEAEAEMHRSVGNHGAAGNLLNAASAIRDLDIERALSGQRLLYNRPLADLRARLDEAYDRAAEELEKAFNETGTLNLLHGAARVRALKIPPGVK